ncbi:MmgE/PrpD family protein [Nocardioides sp. Bht2]|uniref:MmgE/PrpD family protein n=1 Tax=Nocardioides sp. Bht2 TaxID=3392297 RepID=UPI0039B4975F
MIARRLAEWVTEPGPIPEAVDRAASRHLADGLATALGAVRRSQGGPAVTVASGLGGPPEATVLAGGAKLSAPAAALANGTLMHALDFDDTHAGGLVHATSVVAPAAFAVGEQVGATGREVLSAAVVGYEVVCRIAAAAPNGFHARGVHATMAAGVFSSAAVAARLMALDAETTTHALGIAGSQAGGLLAFLATGASTKQLHPGFASQSGILAARLAAAGATGPDTVLDGPAGLFDVLTDGTAAPESVVAELGERWETTRIGIKPYPACQLSHATLDAVLAARAANPFSVEEIVAVRADVHPDSAAVVCDPNRDLSRPASDYAAKFSLPWSVAALIVDGHLGLDSFTTASIARSDVADLAARVQVRVTGAGGFAAADAIGRVELQLSDGRTIHGEVPRSAGGPQNPLSDEALTAKASGLLGQDATRLFELARDLPTAPDLEALLGAIATTLD